MRKLAYTCDFETNTKNNNVKVWAWAFADIKTGKMVKYGNSIKDWFNYINNKNIDIYFHNLKFDGTFILSYLLSNGFKHSREKEPFTFDTLITDTGLFYKITIYWKKYNKRYIKTDIYDSLKKIPLNVETIAKAFNLEQQKGKIDYDLIRDDNHIITDDELCYLKNDVEIMANALNTLQLNGLNKMTIGSDALNNFKGTMGNKKNFRFYFPVLNNYVDDDIRRAYKGGFTYLNPKYKNKIVNGLVFDVNSLYPFVMYNEFLPYGTPLKFEGKYKFNNVYNLYIQRITCAFKLKDNHIPTIQLKNSMRFIPTEYITTTNGDIVELVLTSPDLKLFLKHYDILNLEYKDGYMFKSSNVFFREYINYWYDIKNNSTGGLYTLAKLMLNSLYGKFGTSTKKGKKIPYLDSEGILKYYNDEIKETEPLYTALACFITAYARSKTIKAGQLNYDRFIYSDTDSIHLLGYEIPKNIEIDNHKLGCWTYESKFTKGKYLRAKTYMQTIENKKIITCAGMPKNLHSQVEYNNFKEGAIYFGKLRPKQVKGGTLLVKTTFKITK